MFYVWTTTKIYLVGIHSHLGNEQGETLSCLISPYGGQQGL